MNKNEDIYQIKKPGWNATFIVHVSKTRKAMVKATLDFYKQMKWDPKFDNIDNNETFGRVIQIEGIPQKNEFAHMFLNEQDLDIGVLTHECLHVALAHERLIFRFGMCYGDEITDDEERLCYYHTHAVRAVYDLLIANNHWKLHNG